jgi:hypothetical protein
MAEVKARAWLEQIEGVGNFPECSLGGGPRRLRRGPIAKHLVVCAGYRMGRSYGHHEIFC